MNTIKKIFGGDTRQLGMIFALVALIIFFQVRTGGLTLTPDNVINLFQGNSYILVLAIGMVLVIIAGHIDLSVGSIAAFVGIVVAIAMRDWGIPWYLGVLLGLVVGALIGIWQGIWVAYVGIPAFIVTLAGMLIFRGANQFVGKSNTVPVGEDFQVIGAGYLPEVGPSTGYNNPTLLIGLLLVAWVVVGAIRNRSAHRKVGADLEEAWIMWLRLGLISVAIIAATLLFASGRRGTSFPVSGLILAVLVLLYGFLSTRTIIGRHIYAVGGNRHAAELSGVRSKQVNFLVMMNMAILAALAGHDVRREVQRLRSVRRSRLGARRHRRGLHRWRRRHRWRGDGHRLDHRRSGDGRAEQRSAAPRHRGRLHPDHQGPRAAHRGRLRRLQQAAGQAVDPRPAHQEHATQRSPE